LVEVKEGSTNHVIYDATNLTRKRRRALYTRIKTLNKTARVHIVYFSLPLSKLIEQNAKRIGEERVPDNVIKDMYIKQGIPRIGVDCDIIQLVGTPVFKKSIEGCYTTEDVLKNVNSEWGEELALSFTPHDTPWHLESVDEHIDMTIVNARNK